MQGKIKKHIRRVLAFVVALACVVGISAQHPIAMADEIFEGYRLKWHDNSEGYVRISWFDSSMTNSALKAAIPQAFSMWSAATDYGVTGTHGSSGALGFNVSDASGWKVFVPNDPYHYVLAVTVPYDTNGTQIKATNVASTTKIIRSALILFSPHYNFSSFTSTELKLLVGHELGHVMGFGHVSSGTSVMRTPLSNASSVSSYDKNCYVQKYGHPS